MGKFLGEVDEHFKGDLLAEPSVGEEGTGRDGDGSALGDAEAKSRVREEG